MEISICLPPFAARWEDQPCFAKIMRECFEVVSILFLSIKVSYADNAWATLLVGIPTRTSRTARHPRLENRPTKRRILTNLTSQLQHSHGLCASVSRPLRTVALLSPSKRAWPSGQSGSRTLVLSFLSLFQARFHSHSCRLCQTEDFQHENWRTRRARPAILPIRRWK